MKFKFSRDKFQLYSMDIIVCFIGSFSYAAGVYCFTAANFLAPGGLTGIATIVNYVTAFPIGFFTILVNIPIAIIGFIFLGKHFMFKTILSLTFYTIFLDYVLVHFPRYTNNILVAAIFGGILMGSGVGILLSRGGSSGGMDVINKIIAKRLPHLKIGTIILMGDLVVVTISSIVYQDIEPALYALISMYIFSVALDKVLYGMNTCKFMYIISQRADEISKQIICEMNRGATILESYGAYTGEKKPTVMVAVRQNEYYKLRKIIKKVDDKAFIIVTSATEIVGSGFNKLDT